VPIETVAIPSTFELQAAIVAAAVTSGHPVLDAGRGQPNWLATTPRAAFFTLGQLAVAEAAAAGPNDLWGQTPATAGIADRLQAALDAAPGDGATFLTAAIRFGIDELGFDPDAWVGELVRGVLGAGYPSPTRMLTHVEQVLERYLVAVTGVDPGPPGRFRLFGTEGGAAAMADVFRTLRENDLVRSGDKVAIATPTFSPYLQIPTLEDFGFDVVELRSDPHAPGRLGRDVLERLRDPAIKVFFVVNPGNPDGRAVSADELGQLRELVVEQRPDLVVVADTVYATFVEGFRSVLAEVPRNVICLHSFSKNVGATGNRLGFIAVHADNVLDELLAALPAGPRDAHAARYRSITSDVSRLPFVSRLVADSREVALHNIAGLGTPDQVQMVLFALAVLLPSGAAFLEGTRRELATRRDTLLEAVGLRAPSGQDSRYYALLDVLDVARAVGGDELARSLHRTVRSEDVALRLAREHGVVVLPGSIFGADDWQVRVSLASLSAPELAAVGRALVAVLRSCAP
jgi:aspartate 4-decarboxylase